ncbi:MAG: inositol monophosphatase family protein [Patescibacteria group bacterium]
MNPVQTQHFAEKLAMQAGRLLLRRFGKSTIKVNKGKSDFATDADLASEKLIIKEIRKHFPEDEVIAEETASGNYQVGTPHWGVPTTNTWVIDPLDGTKNFHFGLPNWCISIALQHKGQTVVGVVYAPVSNQLFSAREGGGAKLNGKKIKVSGTARLADSLIVVEIPRRHTSGKRFAKDIQAFTNSLNKVRRVRAFAAAAYDLCLVASGALDGYLDFSRNTKIWDVAAGDLIVREAGGQVSDVTLPNLKFPNVSVLASNKRLHAGFRRLL